MTNQKLLISIITCLLAINLPSQTRFQNYTLKHGLPSNKINDCVKDKHGFMWFATDAGICRFDGIRFTVFNSEKNIGLSEDVFQHIYLKSKDEILFLSYNGELYGYNYSKGRFSNYSLQKKQFANKQIGCIYRDVKGYYWLSASGGLIKTDSSFNVIKEYSLKKEDINPTVSNNTISICEDKNGILWLGMLSRAIFRFNPSTETFSNKGLSAILPLHQQVSDFMYFQNSDYIYAATGGEGLLRIGINDLSVRKWKYDKQDINSLPSDRIKTLSCQGDSILWVGTIDGLASLNLKTGSIVRHLNNFQNPYSIANNTILDLYIDSQNILWVSTFGGISKLILLPSRFTKVSHNPNEKNSISSNKVVHCLKDKYENLWIATSQGIDVKSSNGNTYFHYKLPKSFSFHTNEEIIKFFIDDDVWWIGTWGGGLSRFRLPQNFKPGDNLYFENFFNDGTDPQSISSNFIRSIVKDNFGNLWISTWNGGLNKINREEKNKKSIRFQRFVQGKDLTKSVASNFIESLLIDKEGYLWIASSNGLQRMNTLSNQFEMYWVDKKNPAAPINMSTTLLLDNLNNIWSCTFVGIVKFAKNISGNYTPQVMQHNPKFGFFSMAIDNYGSIWFSTHNSQIGNYNPITGNTIYYSMLEEVDGFDFYLGTTTVDKNDDIYFVGGSGYLFFNSKTLLQNSFIPPVYITSLKVNDREYFSDCDISCIKKVELDYDERNISIGFASLNYIHSEENKYKYLLEGQTNNWIRVGLNKEITFANLQPGKYQLKIMGYNNDGLWNKKEANLLIVVKPPFWNNPYYRWGILLMMIAASFIYFNKKIKRLKTERLKQHQFAKLLIESQEEERKRLSKELHDSLGQNLLVIKNQIDLYTLSEPKNENDLVEISDLIKESITEVKEISSNLHPHQLERLGLTKAIYSMVNKISASSNISVKVEIQDLADSLPKESEINIYRILQEVFNNIIKHSEARMAFLKIRNNSEGIFICVEDNGKGFDINDAEIQYKLTEGLGLKSIKERVRLLRGEIKIESSVGKGTKMEIKIADKK